MIVRDVDLLADLARVASAEVFFSITTVDLDLWRTVEPGTANPFQRLRAMRMLREAGVLDSEKIGKEVFFWVDKAFLEESLEAVLDFIRKHS